MLQRGTRQLVGAVGALFSRASAQPGQQRRALTRCIQAPLALGAAAAALHGAATSAAALGGAAASAAAQRGAAALRALPAALPAALPGWPAATPPAEAARACEDLLRTSVRAPYSTYTLGGLFTVEVAPPFEGAPVLVLLSGYSSGAGMYFASLDALAQHFHVLCVDVLGTGASERPPFAAASVEEAEAFFVAPLERWRQLRFCAAPAAAGPAAAAAAAAPRLTLAGHSLGGYLAAAYALRHPSAVEHLVLVNAAGIPEAADARLAAARARHWAVGAAGWAWEAGATPGALVRGLGPLGGALVEGIVTRRFAGMAGAASAQPELLRYVQAIMSAPGSGEHALRVLFNFGAHAKAPLAPRLLQHWRGRTTLLHGSRDWMDLQESQLLARALRERGGDAQYVCVPHAEHYVFMERPREFAAALAARA